MKRLNKGFTLIELSIVIIIIGFLIAGISGGQALVSSAKLQTFIKDLNTYQQAILGFKERYGYLPGDFPKASSVWPACGGGSSVACNGNGNGKVDGVVDSGTEDLVAFEHLTLGGFLNNKITYDGTLNPGVSVPLSNLQSGAGFWLWNSIVPASQPNYIRDNLLWVGSNLCCYSGNNILNNGALGPNNTAQVDQKIDDGRPGSGLFFAQRAQSRASDATICTDLQFDDVNFVNANYLYSDQSDTTCVIVYSPNNKG